MLGETVGTVVVSGTSSSAYLITATNTTTGVTENHRTRIFHITLLSSGTGSPSALTISNGSGGLPQIIVGGTGNVTGGYRYVEVDYGTWGHTFPSGAYYTTDANLVQAAIICKADKY